MSRRPWIGCCARWSGAREVRSTILHTVVASYKLASTARVERTLDAGFDDKHLPFAFRILDALVLSLIIAAVLLSESSRALSRNGSTMTVSSARADGRLSCGPFTPMTACWHEEASQYEGRHRFQLSGSSEPVTRKARPRTRRDGAGENAERMTISCSMLSLCAALSCF